MVARWPAALRRWLPDTLFGRLALLLIVAVIVSHVLALTLMFELRPAHPGHPPGPQPPGVAADGHSLQLPPPGPEQGLWNAPPSLQLGLLLDISVRLAALVAVAWWAARWLSRPMHRLATAAQELGRDIDRPPLPEDGTLECRDASRVFNQMQARIRQQLAERDRFVAAVSHDLRTPLTRLRAQLYRMRQQVGYGEPQAVALEQVLDETDTLMARFRALLRISELEDHQRRSGFVALAPEALLQEIHAFYAPLAEEKGQWLELELAADLPGVLGDRGLLFEAIGNLLDNAIRFAPEGGRVRLAARVQEGATCIVVEDSGPGIAEAERSLVFQRFHRADASAGGGFGLGLSIVAAIAGLHGFRVTAGESRLGGAGFSLLCRPQVL